jgi:hypothetical protein
MTSYQVTFDLGFGVEMDEESASNRIFEEMASHCEDVLVAISNGRFGVDCIVVAESEQEYAETIGKLTTGLIRALGILDFAFTKNSETKYRFYRR